MEISMLELHLQRIGDTLTASIVGQSATIPLIDVAPFASTWQRVYNESVAYGRDLFNTTFRDEQMRALLTGLPANERLLLVADDLLIATIPWEYLRDANDKLLAARLNLVRGLSREKQHADFAFKEPLEIVAIPVLPIDEPV